jgi:hypothetical protein
MMPAGGITWPLSLIPAQEAISAVWRDRVALIEEAAGRYGDGYDFREVVRDIFACPNLSEWRWPE